MGLFDSFLDTASKGFSWLSENKAALDMLSGAAKGFGTYMSMRQSDKQFNKQFNLAKAQWEDQRRRGGAPSDYNSGDYASVGDGFKPGAFLDGQYAVTPTVNQYQQKQG